MACMDEVSVSVDVDKVVLLRSHSGCHNGCCVSSEWRDVKRNVGVGS